MATRDNERENGVDAAPPSLEALYRRYAPWLKAMLRKRFGRRISDPEDVVQETYLRLATRGDVAPIRHPQALLMRVAGNLARDRLRRDAVATGAVGTLATALQLQSQEAWLADQNDAVLLKQIVLSIPHPHRDVFILSRYGGLTHAQIAQHCGVSVKTVEWRMARALSFCADRLAD